MKCILLCLLLCALTDGFAPPALRTSWRRRINSALFASANGQSADSSVDSCDVAVFGGGFGGLYTALAISRDAQRRGKDLDVVLVEPTETFVFLPLLYDLCVGTATEAEVCPAYNDLLAGTGVRHLRASLESFDDSSDLTQAQLIPTSRSSPSHLSFQACVVAVGASPASMLASVPGAQQYTQPFYTEADAKLTRRLLNKLEESGEEPRIAIVGGGFGGVELAASVQRRLPRASVALLSRGPPMAGTRAEPLVDRALERMGVHVELCTVDAIEPVSNDEDTRVLVQRTDTSPTADEITSNNDAPFDAVLWTAGSNPAIPVANGLPDLRKSPSGRLAMDSTLRCYWNEPGRLYKPCVWALGDCAEIVSASARPAVPKTAQAAMQQADVVAGNLLAHLDGRSTSKAFVFQDLGSMFTLGGPNAGVMAPREGLFAPLFEPVLDTARGALGIADELLSSAVDKAPVVEEWGLSPETLGLSLGSHGIAGGDKAAPGTLAGTLTGAARRAVYAARMPTNRQRGVAAVSAAISTAAALAREASERNKQ